jgi:hypothetical protein
MILTMFLIFPTQFQSRDEEGMEGQGAWMLPAFALCLSFKFVPIFTHQSQLTQNMQLHCRDGACMIMKFRF